MASEMGTPKTKRTRGANWAKDAIKALLDMSITRRNMIRGSTASLEQKDRAWTEIADAVSATGVKRTPAECECKLRCYVSEVKHKFSELGRSSKQTGGGGGTPFKMQQPTELEELALAFQGIEKLYGVVGGRSTPIVVGKDYDYVQERKRELKRGKMLQERFDGVTEKTKRRVLNAATTSEDEDSVQGATPQRPTLKKAKTNARMLDQVLDIQHAVMNRIDVLEGKVDSLVDLVRDLKDPTEDPTDDIAEGPVDAEIVEEIAPPATPPKRNVLVKLKEAFRRYCTSASESEWGRLLIAALKSDHTRKVRERIYLAVIAELGEDGIDDLQHFCINEIPEYVREALPHENRYRLQTIIASDLVASNILICEIDDVLRRAAVELSIRTLQDCDSPMPTISQSLSELYGPKLKTTASSEEVMPNDPQPGTSGVANNTEAKAKENIKENEAEEKAGEDEGSAQVNVTTASGKGNPAKRLKRKRTGKK